MCRNSLQSDRNLRGPHVAWQQQLSIDICCPRLTSAANPPSAAAAVDRRDRQTLYRNEIAGYTLDRINASLSISVIGYSEPKSKGPFRYIGYTTNT